MTPQQIAIAERNGCCMVGQRRRDAEPRDVLVVRSSTGLVAQRAEPEKRTQALEERAIPAGHSDRERKADPIASIATLPLDRGGEASLGGDETSKLEALSVSLRKIL